jgi:hypothetical protein
VEVLLKFSHLCLDLWGVVQEIDINPAGVGCWAGRQGGGLSGGAGQKGAYVSL